MAIRKFHKIMKPFSIVISIVFILSLAYGGYESFKTSRANKKAQEAFELNGKIINKIDIERLKNEIANQYSSVNNTQIDKSLIDIIAFNQIIDKNLTLGLAKKLKIKVPSAEVEKRFQELEESIGDKEQFKRMLDYQGFSKDSYKEKMEEDLLLEKTVQVFSKDIEPTQEEIKDYYDVAINDRNKKFEAVREEIIRDIKISKGFKEYSKALAEARNTMKIKNLSPEYIEFLEKTLYEEKGFKISNLDLAIQTVSESLHSSKNKEEAEKTAKDTISKKIKIAETAKKEGIEITDKMSTLKLLEEYQFELISKYRGKLNPSEAELRDFFNKNIKKYEVKASADVNFAFITIPPSKEDEKTAKAKAEEVLKNVTVDNFEEYGKNLPMEEGYLFENLGQFSKGRMIKEFEEVVAETEANSIAKKIAKTTYGYHIIYVKNSNSEQGNWEASHILVRLLPSEATMNEKMVKIEKIKNDINSGALSFSEAQKVDKNIVQSTLVKGVTPDGIIPNLGYNPELTEKIFESGLNKVMLKNNNSGILMFQKINEIKAEKANFEKALSNVRNDYINAETARYLRTLIS